MVTRNTSIFCLGLNIYYICTITQFGVFYAKVENMLEQSVKYYVIF